MHWWKPIIPTPADFASYWGDNRLIDYDAEEVTEPLLRGGECWRKTVNAHASGWKNTAGWWLIVITNLTWLGVTLGTPLGVTLWVLLDSVFQELFNPGNQRFICLRSFLLRLKRGEMLKSTLDTSVLEDGLSHSYTETLNVSTCSLSCLPLLPPTCVPFPRERRLSSPSPGCNTAILSPVRTET